MTAADLAQVARLLGRECLHGEHSEWPLMRCRKCIDQTEATLLAEAKADVQARGWGYLAGYAVTSQAFVAIIFSNIGALKVTEWADSEADAFLQAYVAAREEKA